MSLNKINNIVTESRRRRKFLAAKLVSSSFLVPSGGEGGTPKEIELENLIFLAHTFDDARSRSLHTTNEKERKKKETLEE